MYYLKKKRQVITLDGQIALIPKNSVNFDKRENASFPSPYFVFSEKVHYIQFKYVTFTRKAIQMPIQVAENFYLISKLLM